MIFAFSELYGYLCLKERKEGRNKEKEKEKERKERKKECKREQMKK